VNHVLYRDEEEPPSGCVPSRLTVTLTVYTPHRDYVDDHIATEHVRAAINAALDHDFPGVAAVRVAMTDEKRS